MTLVTNTSGSGGWVNNHLWNKCLVTFYIRPPLTMWLLFSHSNIFFMYAPVFSFDESSIICYRYDKRWWGNICVINVISEKWTVHLNSYNDPWELSCVLPHGIHSWGCSPLNVIFPQIKSNITLVRRTLKYHLELTNDGLYWIIYAHTYCYIYLVYAGFTSSWLRFVEQ